MKHVEKRDVEDAFEFYHFEAKFSVGLKDFTVTNQRSIQKKALITGKRANLLNIPLTMKSLRDYSEARGKERC